MWTIVSIGLMGLVLGGLVVFLVGLFGHLFTDSVRDAWRDREHRGRHLLAVAIAFGIMGVLVALSFII